MTFSIEATCGWPNVAVRCDTTSPQSSTRSCRQLRTCPAPKEAVGACTAPMVVTLSVVTAIAQTLTTEASARHTFLPSRNVTAEETTVECVLRPGRTALVEAPCRNGCANSAS